MSSQGVRMSYADKLEAERRKREEAARGELITGADPFAEIELALDAREMAMAMRKAVARRVMEKVAADEMGSGDLVRLLGMLNERVDGKVADKVEHSGSLDLAAVVRSVQAKGTSTGLPKPEWFDAPYIDAEVIDE